MTFLALSGAGILILGVSVLAQAPEPTWLDRPFVSNWNVVGRAIPPALTNAETIADMRKRCDALVLNAPTPGERALADAGWLPFHMFDRQIVQRDVEIVGGMAAADGMCRPLNFNVFVFVGGRLAGTLSPEEMGSRVDGSIGGGLRLSEADIIAAEFVRYKESDALCCPSGRVTVRYQIDRNTTPATVVPVAVQPTRR